MSPAFRSIQLNTLNVASNIHCQASVLRPSGRSREQHRGADDRFEPEVVIQRGRHTQRELEGGGDEV